MPPPSPALYVYYLKQPGFSVMCLFLQKTLPIGGNEGAIDGLCENGEIGASGDGEGACGAGDVIAEPLSPVSQHASYDRLNPYANPGELEPVNLVSFAYQIASGMVCG